MVKKYRKRQQAHPQKLGTGIYSLLTAMGGSRPKSRLNDLWHNWNEIMGEEISALMSDFGSHGETLILEAENALQLQNLQFLAEEVREKANAFLGEEYFSSARVSLYGPSRKPQKAPEKSQADRPEGSEHSASALTGSFLAEMDMRSPVARCYARFVACKK